ncbi:MAG: DUF6785 family protein [Armatimonadota bacterium]
MVEARLVRPVDAKRPVALKARALLLRARAPLLATLLAIPNAYWIIQIEKVRDGPYPTSISLLMNALLWLILLLIANALVGRVRPAWRFSPAELLLTYVMLCVSSAMAGHDFTPVLIQMIAHPAYYVREGVLPQQVLEAVPAPLINTDYDALRSYFVGSSTLYRWEHLAPWLVPAAIWLGFIALLWWTMLCLVSLVRRQWMDSERLAFPLVELPVRMVDPAGTLWRTRLFWAGFAVAGGINLINGLHYWFPTIPEIPVKHQDIAPYLTDRPWSAVGWLPVSFYPFVIGIAYLMPLDLAFSIWFFYLFWKAQLVVTAWMGWDITPDFPYIREQGIGAYLGIGLFLLIGSRGLIGQLWRHLRDPARSELRDAGEALPYRTAVYGLAAGLLGLAGFFWFFGLRWHIALGAVALYLLMALVITRIRAEFGSPVHDQHFSGPDHVFTRLTGAQGYTARELGMLNFFYWFNRAYRSHPMPFALEGLKLAQRVGASFSHYWLWMLWAGLWGALLAFWSYLHNAYRYGTGAEFFQGQLFGTEAYNRLSNWLALPQEAHRGAQVATALGFGVAWGMMWLRSKLIGFPLHPIGFAISGSWAMNLVWLPIALAWLIKLLIVRYGGLPMYQRLLPFFLGLIVGEAAIGMGWSLIGVMFDIPSYSFWGQ